MKWCIEKAFISRLLNRSSLYAGLLSNAYPRNKLWWRRIRLEIGISELLTVQQHGTISLSRSHCTGWTKNKRLMSHCLYFLFVERLCFARKDQARSSKINTYKTLFCARLTAAYNDMNNVWLILIHGALNECDLFTGLFYFGLPCTFGL